jgi:hypothetical protein
MGAGRLSTYRRRIHSVTAGLVSEIPERRAEEKTTRGRDSSATTLNDQRRCSNAPFNGARNDALPDMRKELSIPLLTGFFHGANWRSSRGPQAMSEKPHRPRLQIHLSTAIVLMFVAGGFSWANTVNAVARVIHTPAAKGNLMRTDGVCMPYVTPAYDTPVYAQGWPTTIRSELNSVVEWRYRGIASNVAVLAVILLGSAVLCELFIRRHEVRKP